MKLTKRQKRIVLVSVLFFFLAVVVITSTVFVVNKNRKEKVSSQTPKKNNLPNDKSNLTKTRTETITFLEEKLSADNIRNEALLQELKNEHALNAGETN